MRRFEQYALARGINIADPAFWNAILQDLDDRINACEAYATSLDGAVQNVEALGVERVNATLNPLVAEALAKITSVANLLEAGSASSVAIVASGEVTFTIAESDRTIWPLPSFVSAAVVTDPAKYMAGRVVSFDRTSGFLVVDIADHGGSGTYASWVVRLSGMPGVKGDTGIKGDKGDTGDLSGTATNLAATAPSGFTGSNVQAVLASLAAVLNTAAAANASQDTAITGKASIYHSHGVADITNLAAALAVKQNALGYTPVNKAGDAMSASLCISASNSTTRTDYLYLSPSDYGVGKPYMCFGKEATADEWSFALWDGVDNSGTLNFWAQNLFWNGSQIVARDVPNTFTKHQGFGLATLTDASTIAWDVSAAQVAKVTLGGNRELNNPSNAIEGFTYIVIAKQDGTGGRTLSFGDAYLWPDNIAPVIATGANKKTILTFICEGGKMNGVASLNY